MVGMRRSEMPGAPAFPSLAEQSFESPLVRFNLSHPALHERERFVARQLSQQHERRLQGGITRLNVNDYATEELLKARLARAGQPVH